MNNIYSKAIGEYNKIFVQPTPKFGKRTEFGWTAIPGRITVDLIKSHLEGTEILGSLSRYYPTYAILDFDDKPLEFVEMVLSKLGADHILLTSESANSYHALIKPVYNDNRPTIGLLQTCLSKFAKHFKIELYPNSRRFIRLPCSRGTKQLYPEGRTDWMQTLEDFKRLQPFEISKVPAHLRMLRALERFSPSQLDSPDFDQRYLATVRSIIASDRQQAASAASEGAQLYEHGLTSSSSRFRSQFLVAGHLHKHYDLTKEEAFDEMVEWLSTKHNGFSNDASNYLAGEYRIRVAVEREFRSCINAIWGSDDTSTSKSSYSTTATDYDFCLSAEDFYWAADASAWNIPRWKFLCKLIAYFNVRGATYLSIHHSQLAAFSSCYKQHLEYFQQCGILERNMSYLTRQFSKSVKLHKPTRSKPDNFIRDKHGNLPDSFDAMIEALGKDNVRKMMLNSGFKKSAVDSFIAGRFWLSAPNAAKSITVAGKTIKVTRVRLIPFRSRSHAYKVPSGRLRRIVPASIPTRYRARSPLPMP